MLQNPTGPKYKITAKNNHATDQVFIINLNIKLSLAKIKVFLEKTTIKCKYSSGYISVITSVFLCS